MRRAMRRDGVELMLRVSAILALISLALIVWSVLDPTPMPIIVSMSLGQGIGLLSIGLFVFSVYVDLRRGRRSRRESAAPPTEK